MKINNIQNKTYSPNFNGRVQFRNEDYIAKTIDKIPWYDREVIEQELNAKIQKQMPKVKKTIWNVIGSVFPKAKKEQPYQPKTLKEIWTESLNEIKTLVKEKLPNEYVLRNRIPINKFDTMGFSITKGDEHISGVSASIKNPFFPVMHIKETVDIISNPEYKQNVDVLKAVIPNFTESEYVNSHGQFLSSGVLDFAKEIKDLKSRAGLKDLNLSAEAVKKDYAGYVYAKATLTDKNDKVIYQTVGNRNSFEEVLHRVANRVI